MTPLGFAIVILSLNLRIAPTFVIMQEDVPLGNSPMQDAQIEWLRCVRPSMLVFRTWQSNFIEPYWPSHFSHQFGYTQGRAGLPRLFYHGESLILDGWRVWCDFSAVHTKGHLLHLILAGRDIGDSLLSYIRWYVFSLREYLCLGNDFDFI